MNAIQDKAKQSEAIARASIGRLTNEKLAETWMLTNGEPMTRELAITRGWLLAELETRMGQMNVWADLFPAADTFPFVDDRFDHWMIADCGPDWVNPLPYLS